METQPTTPPSQSEVPADGPEPAIGTPIKRVRKRKYMLLGLIPLAILGGGAGAYFGFIKKDKPAAKPTSTTLPTVFTKDSRLDVTTTSGQPLDEMKEFEARLASNLTSAEKKTIEGDLNKYSGTSQNDISHRIVLYKTVLNKYKRQKFGDVVAVRYEVAKDTKPDKGLTDKLAQGAKEAGDLLKAGNEAALNAKLEELKKLTQKDFTVTAVLNKEMDLNAAFSPVYSDSYDNDDFSFALAGLQKAGDFASTVKDSNTRYIYVKLTTIGPAARFESWAMIQKPQTPLP